MKRPFLQLMKFTIPAICWLFLFSFLHHPVPKHSDTGFKFPYKEAGLTDQQAAAHLLSRFSFGATQADVDEVVRIGLEKWFNQQLDAGIADDSLQARLAEYDALKMTNAEVNKVFPRPIHVLRMARQEGIIPKDSANDIERKEYKKELVAYIKQKNFRRQSELFRQFINYKILRAAYSNNQLQEVMTDFWFNHFNVSFTKKSCALFIPAFERDVIRPNTSGKFENLLLATAKSPAMLIYLDNFNSVASTQDNSFVNKARLRNRIRKLNESMDDSASTAMVQKIKERRKNQGLNENYAREVMELHTMGVDGGYTQEDVTQAAKILTGWTVYPMENPDGFRIKNITDKAQDKMQERGFVREGDFLFAMNKHDKTEKTVLGKRFTPDGGYEEGVTLLKMLAHHPSTAAFICKKLAIHFVSDDPPKSLIEKMSKTFLEKEGDIREVLIRMVTSVEFWNKEVIREKTKSPFELVVSAVRTLKADIYQPYQLFTWMDRMGQKIYYFQAPTGFPDRAQYWINTGALLNRMNFGLAIASGRMRGIKTDLLSLNNYHEPESAADALTIYSKLLMPERDLTATIKRLTPLLSQPSLGKKLEDAADTHPAKTDTLQTEDEIAEEAMKENDRPEKELRKMEDDKAGMLAQVVGIIIGSPEFQRK